MRWQPTANQTARVERAALYRQIRAFFEARNVLEVETPLLSQSTVSDVYLDPFVTQFAYGASHPQALYLQTSPEYAMKRLLCAQSGAIYQICKAFRHEGVGRYHNPEFSMLEWYRPGYTHHMLMDEMEQLLTLTLGTNVANRLSYQRAFIEHLALDPLVCTETQLMSALRTYHIDVVSDTRLSRDDCLQLLFSTCIEPVIGQAQPCFVYDFPVSQAALARVSAEDSRVAHRFEVYFKGVELANGFYELTAEAEQRQRFEQDNLMREQKGLPARPLDERFLAALKDGLPDCAGVALGLDRLLMLKIGATRIEEVINFPVGLA